MKQRVISDRLLRIVSEKNAMATFKLDISSLTIWHRPDHHSQSEQLFRITYASNRISGGGTILIQDILCAPEQLPARINKFCAEMWLSRYIDCGESNEWQAVKQSTWL